LILIPQLIATFGRLARRSLGVFVRDIVQGIALVLMAWMYLSDHYRIDRAGALSRGDHVNPFTAGAKLSSRNSRWVKPDCPPCLLRGFALVSFVFGYGGCANAEEFCRCDLGNQAIPAVSGVLSGKTSLTPSLRVLV